MEPEEVFMIVAFTLIVAGITAFIVTALQRGKLRELAHRERLAMIERGLAPPPEVDPARFEHVMGQPAWDEQVAARAARYRRMGVSVMGLGAALCMIIGFAAGEPESAFGVGGAVFILGVALYINSQLELRHAPPKRTSKTLEPRAPQEP